MNENEFLLMNYSLLWSCFNSLNISLEKFLNVHLYLDFSNTRFFEFLDFSNYFLGPLDLPYEALINYPRFFEFLNFSNNVFSPFN